VQREFIAVCSGNQTLREEVTGPSIRKTQNKPKKIISLMITKENNERGRKRGLITK